MQVTKISLLSTYGKLIQRYNKNYVYPSQETLLKLLKQYHHTIISRRALNYHLADLRSSGLIRTIRRNVRNAHGQVEQLTSATCLTIKACKLLYNLGSAWALRHLKKLRDKYLPALECIKGLAVPTVTPGEEPPRLKPGQSLFSLMQSEEYLTKYPKMRSYVEKKAREAEKAKKK